MVPEEELNPQEIPSAEEPSAETPVFESTSEAISGQATDAAVFGESPAEAATEDFTEPVTEEIKNEPVEEVKPASATLPRLMVGHPHPKKSFWSKVLPWIIIPILFFLGGLATLYFAVYQPEKVAAKAALAEQSATATAASEADSARIISLTNDYNQALKQYQEAQSALDLTRGELEAAKSTLAEKDAALAKSTTANLAYKFLVDVSSAQTALEKNDTATVRQALNYAKADLDQLKSTELTADVLSGFAEKLNEAQSNLTPTGIEKSRAALVSLYTNLLMLIDNLP